MGPFHILLDKMGLGIRQSAKTSGVPCCEATTFERLVSLNFWRGLCVSLVLFAC